MSNIWVTSDTHFGHDKEFIWGPRGYQSVEENDKDIIQKWNSIVTPEDIVYHLGDVMLGPDMEYGINCLKQLNGNIHIIRGNHDTNKRWAAYEELPNVTLEGYATILKYKKWNFYLSHFPTITANLGNESIRQCTINLYGHTHQQTNFYEERPYMYHIGIDSHNSAPVLLDNIIDDIYRKVDECKKYL